jgi:two-component system, NtrC family, sensor kinase
VNSSLQHILDKIIASPTFSEEEKSDICKALKQVDSALALVQFKYERTEKVKRTTEILLEETIEELQKKSLVIEQSNIRLTNALKDLKDAQNQLILSEKMASLGQLTAGIAHEIQNPLNFVNNFSEASEELITELNEDLASGRVSEAMLTGELIKQNLQKINHHGKRAGTIVKGMLQHSRTSTGKKELTDINALTYEYLRLSYHGLRAKDKTFSASIKVNFDETLDGSKSEDYKVNIIAQDIGRVILNLVTNAFYAVAEKKKYASHYEPAVSVSTKRISEKVLLSVRDNGTGIATKTLDKIFQPFFTTKPTGEGTGLGLSLSYDIVQAHGGELQVETEEGEFSEFTIILPI